MKKLLTTLVLVMVLVCAFCVVSYAAGEFEVTYTAVSTGEPATVSVDTLSSVVYQANNANAKDAEFEVKLVADVASGTGNNTAFGNNAKTGGPSTVVFNLNGKTLTMDRKFVAKDGVNLTIKNGTINYTGTADYPFLAQTGATIITEDLTITSAAGGLSTTYSASNGGGNLKVYNTNITAAAVTLYAMSTNAEVEVYGGNFVSSSADGSIFKFHGANSVKIYGGTYSNTTEEPADFAKLNSGNIGSGYGVTTFEIYGGTYPVAVHEDVLASGYANVDNGNGTFTVGKEPTDVTSGANVNYADGNDTYTYRFFKAIADYSNCASVVFEITAGENTWEIELNEVYGNVTVDGESYVAADAYVVTGAIGDVPTDDVEFTVNAYAVDFEGNRTELN